MLSSRVVKLVRVQGRRRRAARARSSTSSISCHCGCHFCHAISGLHARPDRVLRAHPSNRGPTSPPVPGGDDDEPTTAAWSVRRETRDQPVVGASRQPCRLGFCCDPFSGDRHRYLTNAVEQLDDQRHERCRRDTVQRHSEAGEGSGYLILLKGASGGDAVARQAHRETASVPFPNAR